MDLITLLQSVSIFRGIEPSLLSQLAALLKRIELSENTEIFKEGQIADAFYIIDSGNVVIAKHLGPNNEKILAVLGDGEKQKILSQLGLENLKKYSWSKMVGEIKGLYLK